MKNRVRGGTARADGPALCLSCSHASHVHGQSLDDSFMTCNEISGPFQQQITFKVTSCTAYLEKGRPSIRYMEQIAWSLVTDRNATRIGFMSPGDFRKAIKKKELDEPEPIQDPLVTRDY